MPLAPPDLCPSTWPWLERKRGDPLSSRQRDRAEFDGPVPAFRMQIVVRGAGAILEPLAAHADAARHFVEFLEGVRSHVAPIFEPQATPGVMDNAIDVDTHGLEYDPRTLSNSKSETYGPIDQDEKREERGQKSVAGDKLRASWPVGMVEIEAVHDHP